MFVLFAHAIHVFFKALVAEPSHVLLRITPSCSDHSGLFSSPQSLAVSLAVVPQLKIRS